jgi:bifunctional DNA-binding transcriptional regulator/antitoxin component of YhaV-PrlF toxin-antitoxin module
VVRFPCFLVFHLRCPMLAKKTVKNQITLPKKVVTRFKDVEYFDVTTDGDSIILRPLQQSRADEVRTRLAQLGIDEQDIPAAVRWAHKTA